MQKVSDISEALEVLEQILAGNPPPFHILGTSEVSKKLKIPEDQLVSYLQKEHNLHQEGPPIIRQFKHGQSNPTYYVAYGGEELVLRKKPVSALNLSFKSKEGCLQIIFSKLEMMKGSLPDNFTW